MIIKNRVVKRGKKRSIKEMLFFTIGIIAAIGVVSSISYKCDKPNPKMLKCHAEGIPLETLKYQAYFHKAQAGINALEVAKAVQHSKRKRMTAAICMIESGGKKTAYNRRSHAKGAFQVMEKHWGKVNTKSALAMTAQHDAIMDELLIASNGNVKKALNYYGGDKTKKVYAENIFEEIANVP